MAIDLKNAVVLDVGGEIFPRSFFFAPCPPLIEYVYILQLWLVCLEAVRALMRIVNTTRNTRTLARVQ